MRFPAARAALALLFLFLPAAALATPSFQAHVDTPLGFAPEAMTSGDLNADGFPDLVVTSSSLNAIMVLLRTGLGSAWTLEPALSGVGGPLPCAVGNLNADAYPDLVVGNSGPPTLQYFTGLGDGTFDLLKTRDIPGLGTPGDVAIGFLNVDAHPDLVATDTDNGAVAVYLWSSYGANGVSNYSGPVEYLCGAGPQSVVIADLDGDGLQDLVVANSVDGNIAILFGNGAGTFKAPVTYPAGDTPSSVAVADLDGDGHPDIVVANQYSNTLSVFLNQGNGTFPTRVDLPTRSRPVSVRIADLDLDGKPDLAVACYGSSVVSVFQGLGGGSFGTRQDVATGSHPVSLVVTDVNEDGGPDLVTANGSGQSVSVLLNQAHSTGCAVSVSCLSSQGVLCGGVETLGFTITNPGPGSPAYTYLLTESAAPSWITGSSAPLSGNTPALPVGGTYTLLVDVAAGGGCPAQDVFHFRAGCAAYPGIQDSCSTVLNSGPHLGMLCPPGETLGCGSVSRVFRIVNFAGIPTALHYTLADPAGWVAGSSLPLSGVSPVVAPGDTFALSVQLRPAVCSTSATLQWMAWYTGPGAVDMCQATYTSAAPPGLTCPASQPIACGARTGLTFVLQNPGSQSATYDYALDDSAGWLADSSALLHSTVTLGSGQTLPLVVGLNPGNHCANVDALRFSSHAHSAPTSRDSCAVRVTSMLPAATVICSPPLFMPCGSLGYARLVILNGSPVTTAFSFTLSDSLGWLKNPRAASTGTLAPGRADSLLEAYQPTGACTATEPIRLVVSYAPYPAVAETCVTLVTARPHLFTAIAGVADVPADEGGYVNVRVQAALEDSMKILPQVTGYDVWRRFTPATSEPAVVAGLDGARPGSTGPFAGVERGPMRLAARRAAALGFPPGSWESMGFHAALQQGQYNLLAPTRRDSTSAGTGREVYVVTTHTTDAYDYFVSAADSGYSVDNLPPAKPGALAGNFSATGVTLTWSPNVESDLAGYRVYRGGDAAFAPSPATRVGEVASAPFADAHVPWAYYKVTAYDRHGNEGLAAALSPPGPGAAGGVPQQLFLGRPAPNPTSGGVLFSFGLPGDAEVSLCVFDARGRQVRALAVGVMRAGEWPVSWDGRDEGGARVAAGNYFLRLATGARTLTRRIVILH